MGKIKVGGLVLLILGVLWLACDHLRCNSLLSLIPKVEIKPVITPIPPGATVEFGRNYVRIKPARTLPLPGKTPTPEPTPIWHPVESRPWVDGKNILHVPRSGFCLVALVGGNWNTKTSFDWELGARVFYAGQYGLEIAANDRRWAPEIDLRPFDSNVLVGLGPSMNIFSFGNIGIEASVKLDLLGPL